MNEDSRDPTVPEERIITKPVNSVRYAVYFLIGIFGLFIVSNVARQCGRPEPMARSPQALPPTVAQPESVNDFTAQQALHAAQLKKQAKDAADAVAKAKSAYEAFSNHLPCTAALAGTRGTASNGTPIVCGSDGLWHPASIAAADVNTTNPAADRRARARQGAVDSALRTKEEREHRRLAALASPTIAIDFTEQRERSAEAVDREPEKKPAAVPVADAKAAPTVTGKPAKYDWAQHTGKTYKVFEGTILETVLTNRINGAGAGPINTMMTTDVWSQDHQKLLIPQGTRCLGNVGAVNSGDQQRLLVAFHRCILPDGYPLDLDRFAGLNPIGEVGLRDLVNHHYFQIFGASLAVGAIGGLAQIGNYSNAFGYDPRTAIRNGVSQQMSQESIHILDRFLNRLPTFTIRERARVKIYLSADLDVPAYDSHTVDPTL